MPFSNIIMMFILNMEIRKCYKTFIVYLFYTSYLMCSSFVFWLDFFVLPFRVVQGIVEYAFNIITKHGEEHEVRIFTDDLFEKPEKYHHGIANNYSCSMLSISIGMIFMGLLKLLFLQTPFFSFYNDYFLYIFLLGILLCNWVVNVSERKSTIREINKLLKSDHVNYSLCFLCFVLIVFGGIGSAYYVCFF